MMVEITALMLYDKFMEKEVKSAAEGQALPQKRKMRTQLCTGRRSGLNGSSV